MTLTDELAKALPKGPWHYETTALPGEHEGNGHVYLVDANNRKIATCWGPAETKLALVLLMIKAEAHYRAQAGRPE